MLAFCIPILLFLLGLVASWGFMKQLQQQTPKGNNPKLPPSPPRLPIIGHLHLLGRRPHRSLQKLSKKYGPIMHLKLGTMNVFVVSSPQMAELLLKDHDSTCSNRPISQVTHELSYGLKGFIFTSYGPNWANRRKLCVVELMSTSKIRSFSWLREEEMGKLVHSIKNDAEANRPVDVVSKMGSVLENLTYKMLYGTPTDENLTVKAIVSQALGVAGTLNFGDYLPFLAPFDIQGLRRHMKKLMKVMNDVFEKILNEHEEKAQQGNKENHRDLVDVMLSLMKNGNSFASPNGKASQEIERDNIKAILVDLIVPAIDSATNTVKWALASLIKHPNKMRKLQGEIESVVGMARIVDEKDLPNLHYLDMVIKEIFRLYPIIFAPRETMEDIKFDGYYVPKGSKILLNAWAIGRDPDIWSNDCEEFRPERFINNNVDIISGKDFRLAPFGFGRRKCLGTQLGLLNVKLLLSQLVHCFDWKMPNGMSPHDLVMQEKFGLVLSMTSNLVIVPTYRLNV